MKITLLLTFLYSISNWASLSVVSVLDEALEQYEVSQDKKLIRTFKVEILKERALVNILNFTKQATFECREHSDHVDCDLEKSAFHTLTPNAVNFEDMMEALNLSVKKMLSQGVLLDSIKKVKSWGVKSSGDSVDKVDMLVRFDYLNSSLDLKTIFSNCHRHKAQTNLSCHLSKEGEGEPNF